MIQDIFPSQLKNEFIKTDLQDEDYLMIFDEAGNILVGREEGKLLFIRAGEIQERKSIEAVYLFSVDDQRYFLAQNMSGFQKEGFSYWSLREIFNEKSRKGTYAAFTAYHLWKWYTDNRFCGKCGGRLGLAENERALVCPDCGNIIYPRINPAVIVGVINGDRILVTRYRAGYGHNALIAGFTEIGETMEETVKREVMEEAGIKVKNIRYYKSQPWGMALDILIGFYCEVDGDPRIHMDTNELKYAEWVKQEDIVLQPNDLSLTNEMMKLFRESGDVSLDSLCAR